MLGTYLKMLVTDLQWEKKKVTGSCQFVGDITHISVTQNNFPGQ